MGHLITTLCLSERRSSRIVRFSRSVQQYRPKPRTDEAVIERMKALASENRRYGYLRLHAMLRRVGLVENRKRIWRRYVEQGLQVRTKKRRKLLRRDRAPAQAPERPMQRWSLDFVSDQLADYRRFRVLNIVDALPGRRLPANAVRDHSRFCPGQIVHVSISGARIARFLDDLALRVGLPEEIVLELPVLASLVRATTGDGPGGDQPGDVRPDRADRRSAAFHRPPPSRRMPAFACRAA